MDSLKPRIGLDLDNPGLGNPALVQVPVVAYGNAHYQRYIQCCQMAICSQSHPGRDRDQLYNSISYRIPCGVPLQRTNRGMDPRARQAIFDRFAPVVGTMLVLVYYFALLAKLNTDFLISETSCTTILNRDLLNLFPFLPDTDLTKVVVIWATLLVEFSIPVLLTFRRTRYAAILLGLGFHFMLGLIGHRTFSALAFALYILYCIGPVTSLLNYVIRSVRTKRDPDAVKRYLSVARVVALLIGLLFVVELTGNYPPESGPLSIARVDWAFWLFGSATVALVYVSAIVLSWLGRIDLPRLSRVGRPGLLWLMVLLVVLNGMAQYIGLKTKTSFTMYSNLRTEGEYNNHLFMPAWRVAGYQDDLVDIVKTDHPRLQVYIDRKQYITYFEFRRLVSTTRNPFHVTYLRGDTSYEFALRDGVSTDAELSQEYPTWLSKLLYFRPISKGEVVRCLH